ncbi:hypothetical protein GGX14DRAFT_582774 [Mycena pura]|uniref:Uncharacterized protein n=1 Tax=Mycena pura TaxID=153505 RepID=A0AAD6YV16_9AGAR|nr:hypothetical protein GGX14DRAFT_582774 [Mycena pura]
MPLLLNREKYSLVISPLKVLQEDQAEKIGLKAAAVNMIRTHVSGRRYVNLARVSRNYPNDPTKSAEALFHHGETATRVLQSSSTTAFFALLPATVALTRIEAVLLPADAQPVVPFDRAALVGTIDLAAPRASRALFVAAWRSVDRAARVRLLKLYVKMLGAQLAVALVGVQLMAAEVYVIGGERLTVLLASARAQLELAAVEMQQKST